VREHAAEIGKGLRVLLEIAGVDAELEVIMIAHPVWIEVDHVAGDLLGRRRLSTVSTWARLV